MTMNLEQGETVWPGLKDLETMAHGRVREENCGFLEQPSSFILQHWSSLGLTIN